jgi:predicted membrane channel-forming protein YqfA (hemolysin III family)
MCTTKPVGSQLVALLRNALARCTCSWGRFAFCWSGNIWTHLLGAVGFLFIAGQELGGWFAASRSDPDTQASAVSGYDWSDAAVLGVFYSSVLCCLLLSTVFHTLFCHSQSWSVALLRCDWMGIACLIYGSYLPAIYYGNSVSHSSIVSICMQHNETEIERSMDRV